MIEWIFSFINDFGYLAVAILIAIENIFPPIPSEVILSFSGFLTDTTQLNIFGLVIASTIGAVIGALILYWIGTLLNEQRLEKLLDHPTFKKLGFKKGDVKKTINWFNSFGTKAIFFGRFVPVIRSLVSIPAGIAKTQLLVFIILTTLGSAIWNIVLISLGAYMGQNWEKIVTIFEEYSLIVAVLLVIIFIYFAIIWYKKRIKKSI